MKKIFNKKSILVFVLIVMMSLMQNFEAQAQIITENHNQYKYGITTLNNVSSIVNPDIPNYTIYDNINNKDTVTLKFTDVQKMNPYTNEYVISGLTAVLVDSNGNTLTSNNDHALTHGYVSYSNNT